MHTIGLQYTFKKNNTLNYTLFSSMDCLSHYFFCFQNNHLFYMGQFSSLSFDLLNKYLLFYNIYGFHRKIVKDKYMQKICYEKIILLQKAFGERFLFFVAFFPKLIESF